MHTSYAKLRVEGFAALKFDKVRLQQLSEDLQPHPATTRQDAILQDLMHNNSTFFSLRRSGREPTLDTWTPRYIYVVYSCESGRQSLGILGSCLRLIVDMCENVGAD